MFTILRRSSISARRSLRSMSTSLPPVSNASRPQAWKAAAPAPPAGSLTFAAQSNLPKLPVPEINATAQRLKASLTPLARDETELREVERKIDAFAAGQAPELQRRLLERAANTAHWLEEWWDDAGYQGYRDSVVINVSYYYGFDDPPESAKLDTPAHRAAGLTRAVMLFRQRLKQGLIKPDATKEGPHCMDTWRWMFDCCRVPGLEGLDWSVTYTAEGDKGDTGHIVVLRKGRVWKVETARDGRLLSTEELLRQFVHIYDNTSRDYLGVGVLTASNRDVWAKDYAVLAADARNASILRAIHSSAFVVCLDDDAPAGPIEASRALWHGAPPPRLGLYNRWADKPCQFIIADNGRWGIMGEHSVMDGTPTARMCDEVLDALYDPAFAHGSAAGAGLVPEALDWRVAPETETAIARAAADAAALIGGQALGFRLTSYGKAAIKAFGVSPDAWAQLLVQLAYARLLRATGAPRAGGTYEAASTRKFYKGRTEAIRVVTEESDAWVRAMDEEGVDDAERRRLMSEAAKRHIGLARDAGNGQGVDRHLLGLRYLVREDEAVPELYSDPLYLRAKNWVLSTSAIFSKHFPVYGWGEVVPEGFGVAYMTGYDDRLQFTITSRTEMPNEQFCDEIARAAEDLHRLYAPTAKL